MTDSTRSTTPTKTSWYSFMTNVQYLAQIGHFFGALCVVFLMGTFCGSHGLWYTFGIGLVYATLKEFVFDIRIEKDTWANSVMDFSFYVFGGLVAVGLFCLAVRMGRFAVPPIVGSANGREMGLVLLGI